MRPDRLHRLVKAWRALQDSNTSLALTEAVGWSQDGVVEVLIDPAALAHLTAHNVNEQRVREALNEALQPNEALREIYPPAVTELRLLTADDATRSVARLSRAALFAAEEAHNAATAEDY